jgi:hypothetical protein
MSSDQSMFDKAKDAASGLKNKVSGMTGGRQDQSEQPMKAEQDDQDRESTEPREWVDQERDDLPGQQ